MASDADWLRGVARPLGWPRWYCVAAGRALTATILGDTDE